MNILDYSNIITKLSDSSTVAEAIVELSDKLKTDTEDYDKIVSDLATTRETNRKLALRVTGISSDKPNDTDDIEKIEEKIRGFYHGNH